MISALAMDKRRWRESWVSVFLPFRRFSSSDIDGGFIKMSNGSRSLFFICITPCMSMSRTHILPLFLTSSTAFLLKWTIKWRDYCFCLGTECRMVEKMVEIRSNENWANNWAKLHSPCPIHIIAEYSIFNELSLINEILHIVFGREVIMFAMLFTRSWYSGRVRNWKA